MFFLGAKLLCKLLTDDFILLFALLIVTLTFVDPTKPFVKLIPSAREVKVLEKKQRVKVVCSYLSGLPRPIMKWKDPQGKVIHECDEYNTNCTLDIISPEYSKNNGRYTCQASNKAGDFNIDVKVSVLGKFFL